MFVSFSSPTVLFFGNGLYYGCLKDMNLLKVIKTHWILLAIFLIGLFLRVHSLNDYPVGIHGDEASIGYNAYSLLKTARDQNNNFLPLAIDQFGDFRPAGYHFLAVPFVAILGLNETAVRLPGALFGTLSIIALFLLLEELFNKRAISLLAAGLLAILPWHINISRATSEGVVASFLVIIATFFFLRGIKQKKNYSPEIILSLVLFVISFFFYHAARYFVAVFFPILMVYTFLTARQKMVVSVVLYAVLLVSLFVFLTVGRGTGRVNEVSIFSIPGGTQQLKQAMDEEGTLNPLINRFYNNKAFYFGRFFVTFYSQHLSGDFLFVNTGLPVRYKVPFTGNLYLIMAPFLLLGFAFLLSDGIRRRHYLLLIPIAWLLIAPIPAGLTWEDLPNVQRSSLMIPALVAITAFGFYAILTLLKGKVKIAFVVVCGLILLQSFLNFYHNYFWRARIHEPWYRGAAEKELIYHVDLLSKQYPKIAMTYQNDNNLISYLFYTKFDPKTFQEMGSPKEKDVLKFNNLVYYNYECPLEGKPKVAVKYENTIFINKPECSLPKNAQVINVIRTPDGVPKFHIIKLEKN